MNTDHFFLNTEISLPHNERFVLQAIQFGDERAFSLLFDHYKHRVYNMSIKIIRSHELAEEVLYAVFLKIWQHGALDEIEHFESYLRVLTRNQTLKAWRSLQLEQRRDLYLSTILTPESRNTEDTVAYNEISRLLKEAVEKLPPQQSAVYRLCHEEGKKYEEAAALLSLSKLTVKTHLQLAMRFIRKYLKSHTEIALAILCIRYFLF